MAEQFVDYYRVLEVHIFASKDALKAAYKRLAVMHHPDNGGRSSTFDKIQCAYETLMDDKRREEYLDLWKKYHFSSNDFCKYPFGKTYYDLAFQPLRDTVHAYMFYIMNKEYEKAYSLLSEKTSKNIFKKDYMKWQELVGQVHEILGFESSFDTMEFRESNLLVVVFSIKVKEYNLLLKRIEEDYFKRMVILEDDSWKILLNHINVRQVIKKYKQIVDVHKKSIRNNHGKEHDHYVTKHIDYESFVHNVEYEYLRYLRYRNVFGLLAISVPKREKISTGNLIKAFEINVRITDSYCAYNEYVMLLLLPETDLEGCRNVKIKIMMALEELCVSGSQIDVTMAMIDETIESSKELINRVICNE